MTTRRITLIPESTHDPNKGNTMVINPTRQQRFSYVVKDILKNKWKLSNYKCEGFSVFVPPKHSEHLAVTEGYGYWYECDLNRFDTGAEITTIYVTDGRIPNNLSASTVNTKENYLSFKCNIFTLMTDDLVPYSLDLNTQQYQDDRYTDERHVPFYDCDYSKGTYPYTDIEYNLITPTVKATISTQGNLIDNPVSVTWNTNVQDYYTVNVNGLNIRSELNKNTRTLEIPSQFLVVGENTIKVTCDNRVTIYNYNEEITQGSSIVKVNLSTAVPTLSNISLQNDNMLIDNVTTIRWKSTWQNKVNFYVDNILKHSITSNTLQECKLPSGIFHIGSNALKVEIIKNQVSSVVGTLKSVDNTTTHNFTRIEPTITNLSLSSTNRDRVNILKYDCTNYTKYTVYINGIIYESGNPIGEKNNEVIIQAGSLAIGKNKIKVEIMYDSFEKVLAESTIEIISTQDNPEIYSLEPSGVNIDINNDNVITFSTNEYIDRWELSSNLHKWTGTTNRLIHVSSNKFIKGNNTLKLICHYIPKWNTSELRTIEKIVTFTGYGIPNTPIQDGVTSYPTATPTLRWEFDDSNSSDSQIEVEIIINKEKEEIHKRNIISANKSYTLPIDLVDKSEYESLIRIKNKYNIWSNYSRKIFSTNFTNNEKPELYLTMQDYSVLVSAETYQTPDFKEIRVYRRYKSDWIEIGNNMNSIDSIIDYTVPNGKIEYKRKRKITPDI